jgi:putative transposase
VLFALMYLLLRRLVRLFANSSDDLNSDEVVVLRHQLMVLKRQVDCPRLRRRDRLFMIALSRALPRPRGRRLWSAPRPSFDGIGSW